MGSPLFEAIKPDSINSYGAQSTDDYVEKQEGAGNNLVNIMLII